MKCQALRRLSTLITVAILIFPIVSLAQTKLSHVRVVRLSYVSGTVALKRPASTDWAKALVNTPIQEGFDIKTSANSYAEVEFENGSTARLGELSKLSFEQLAMDEDGNKLNCLVFDEGYATFHFIAEHHDAYSVKVAETILTPGNKSEFRADLQPGRARVEVFSGSVEVATASHSVKLGKNKLLEFDPGTTEIASNVTNGIVKDPWDKWTSQRDTQMELAMNDQGMAMPGHSPRYGWSDLDAYGEWGYFPGFGYGWSPFAAAGWSPYTMGMWSFYPGMGYTWISGEPWGWMPYHYGNWNFASGFGWFWMPGNFGAFSPALVNWYSGPGWVGWTPQGRHGAPGQGVVATVPNSAIQNGQMLGSHNVIPMPVTAGQAITNVPILPGSAAMLPGPHLSTSSETSIAPRAGTLHAIAPHTMAPPSILMGGNPAFENSLQGKHAFTEPLRARMGTTLGGQYAVGGAVGEFHGDAFRGAGASQLPAGMNGPGSSRGSGMTAPTILSHGQQSSSSPQMGGGAVGPAGGAGMGNYGRGTTPSMGGPGAAPAGSPTGGGGGGGGGGGHGGGPPH